MNYKDLAYVENVFQIKINLFSLRFALVNIFWMLFWKLALTTSRIAQPRRVESVNEINTSVLVDKFLSAVSSSREDVHADWKINNMQKTTYK